MTETEDIVPEGFDLRSALYAQSTTDEAQQDRCPHCQSTNISRKVGNWMGDGKRKSGNWRCNNHDCQSHFDVPDRGEHGDE